MAAPDEMSHECDSDTRSHDLVIDHATATQLTIRNVWRTSAMRMSGVVVISWMRYGRSPIDRWSGFSVLEDSLRAVPNVRIAVSGNLAVRSGH